MKGICGFDYSNPEHVRALVNAARRALKSGESLGLRLCMGGSPHPITDVRFSLFRAEAFLEVGAWVPVLFSSALVDASEVPIRERVERKEAA